MDFNTDWSDNIVIVNSVGHDNHVVKNLVLWQLES